MEEIERLKSEVSKLKESKSLEVKPPIWESTSKKSSRLDEICKDRDAAMERLSIKLFGRVYAKQEQN